MTSKRSGMVRNCKASREVMMRSPIDLYYGQVNRARAGGDDRLFEAQGPGSTIADAGAGATR